jgi:hypothetical protein
MSLEAAEREYLKYLQNKVKQSKNAAAAAAAAESKQEDLVASAIPSVVEPVIKKRGRKPKSDEAVAAPIAC